MKKTNATITIDTFAANAIILLFLSEKMEKRVDFDTLAKYQREVMLDLENKNYSVTPDMNKNLFKNSKYLILVDNKDEGYIEMAPLADVRMLITRYRTYIPVEIASAFTCDKAKAALGIKSKS